MHFYQTDLDGFKSRPFSPLLLPITVNGNELHMRFFIGMRSVALIRPGLYLRLAKHTST